MKSHLILLAPSLSDVRAAAHRCLILLWILGATACQLISEPPAEVTPEVEATPETAQPVPDPTEAEINRLLAEADALYEANALTTPLDNNAYFRYLQVLAMDEDNVAALQGLNDIVEKYLEWAIEEAENGSLRQATHYLNSARSIDEAHPNIGAVSTMISDRRNATRENYPLSQLRLDNRAPSLAEELGKIGKTASDKAATVTIIARDDEDGRWIYQQLNAASEDRIRARMQFGNVPEVRLVY